MVATITTVGQEAMMVAHGGSDGDGGGSAFTLARVPFP